MALTRWVDLMHTHRPPTYRGPWPCVPPWGVHHNKATGCVPRRGARLHGMALARALRRPARDLQVAHLTELGVKPSRAQGRISRRPPATPTGAGGPPSTRRPLDTSTAIPSPPYTRLPSHPPPGSPPTTDLQRDRKAAEAAGVNGLQTPGATLVARPQPPGCCSRCHPGSLAQGTLTRTWATPDPRDTAAHAGEHAGGEVRR